MHYQLAFPGAADALHSKRSLTFPDFHPRFLSRLGHQAGSLSSFAVMFLVLAVLLIIIQVALAAVIYLGLRFELKSRQQREFQRTARRVSKFHTKILELVNNQIDELVQHKLRTSEAIDGIRKAADKALTMSNDMSRRFDGGEKPKPNVNSLSPEALREARETNFIQKHFADNGRKAEQ